MKLRVSRVVAVCAVAALWPVALSAQSAHVSRQLADVIVGPPAGAPGNSVYWDAQVAYMLTDNGDFSDVALAAFATQKTLFELGNLEVPFLANFDVLGLAKGLRDVSTLTEAREKALESIADVAASRRGALFGLFPFLNAGQYVTIHGAAAGKVNSFNGTDEADTETKWLPQFRGTLGAELHTATSGNPWSVGVAISAHLFSADRYEALFGERRGSIAFLEAHAGIPLPDAFGNDSALFAEYVTSVGDVQADVNGLRLGVLILR